MPSSSVVLIPVSCSKCKAKLEIDCVHLAGFGLMNHYAVDCPRCRERIHALLPGDILGVRLADASQGLA